MVRKILLFILLIFCLPLYSETIQSNTDFRSLNFGATKQQILDKETAKYCYFSQNCLVFYDKTNKQGIIYYILENTFVIGSYYYTYDFNTAQEGMDSFFQIRKGLIDTYGVTDVDISYWQTEKLKKQYFKQRDLWASLIFAGKLTLNSVWRQQTMVIELGIKKKQNNVVIYEKYISKKYLKLIMDYLYNRKKI